VESLVDWFLTISAVWAVAVVFLVPALETAVVLGLVLPGEVTIVLGGVLAGEGEVPLLAILIAGVVGPMTGDVIGYFLGRRYGEEIVRRKLKKKWERAHRWLSKNGGAPIFLGRFLPFLRSVLPTTAGAMALRPSRFLAWDLPAASLWGVLSALLGYFAARDFERVVRFVQRFGFALLAVALIGAGVAIWRRRSRRSGAKRISSPESSQSS
jgi:membrane-associated protein